MTLATVFKGTGSLGHHKAAAHRRGLNGTLTSYPETVKVALVHLDATDQPERVVDAIRATRHGRPARSPNRLGALRC
jgi:hypothetical protein